MKKKGLNRQQLSRIHQRQAGHARDAVDPTADVNGPERQGRVLSHYGQQLDIECTAGEDVGTVYRCFQRSNLEPLVTGDNVVFRAGNPAGIVLALLPRRALLSRPNKLGELKPVAANVDRLLLVLAPQPEPHANLIDRYLVAAEYSNLQPALVLNKCDLFPSLDPAPLRALLAVYSGIGYPVLEVSSHTGAGLDTLRAILAQHTSIFVGQSGVGKSALVNSLLPGVNTLVGSLSAAALKGRHTTTAARLFHFPDGGDLIDSPGIREFGLGHIPADALLAGFVEFRNYTDRCRFRDCRHEHEPGCQLLAAVHEGAIDPRRLASYRLLRDNLTRP